MTETLMHRAEQTTAYNFTAAKVFALYDAFCLKYCETFSNGFITEIEQTYHSNAIGL